MGRWGSTRSGFLVRRGAWADCGADRSDDLLGERADLLVGRHDRAALKVKPDGRDPNAGGEAEHGQVLRADVGYGGEDVEDGFNLTVRVMVGGGTEGVRSWAPPVGG